MQSEAVLTLFAEGQDTFGRHVRRATAADLWAAPTPCTDWTVRDLVNHLTVEHLWVPPLLEGRTVAEVGDRFDGDVLGDDPAAAWEAAAAASRRALGARHLRVRAGRRAGRRAPAAGPGLTTRSTSPA